ncbi:MAG: ABC transporter permease [Chloroflexi bacterium]|nr:ABC transporter permease [Chloroflexota bacterium]
MKEARPPRVQAADAIRRLVGFVGAENLSLLFALAIVVVLIAAQNSRFFLPANLLNIGGNVSVVGLLALGETVVILAGALDISVGSIAGIASVVGALAVTSSGAMQLGIVGGILAGLLFGVVNGLIITVLRVNAVIATLATLSAFQGVAFLIAPNGKPVGVLDRDFAWLGSGRILSSETFVGIPISLIILLVVAVAAHVLMRYTQFGRSVYAMGGNAAAARLAGINVNGMKIAIFGLSGAVAGLAGVISTARTTSGQPGLGSQGLELEAITAVFLGGAALTGGKGTIAATMLAVVLIGTLSNGMNLLGIQTFYQDVAKGLLLVVAVAIGQWRAARAERARTRLA